jgi:BirA family biotin operon repressor/biotin-[acetyl-CoA-carboxylase] ligase
MSPKGKGIWMTILLKPHIAPSEASKITLAAAYALCTALDKCGLDVRIKWPNDIVVNGKKLCGILTEMSADMDIIKYIVVGIGLNANLDAHDFDSAIAATATSIKIEAGKSISRKTVVSHILNEFERVYDIFTKEGSIESFLEEYKLRSAVIGKEIRVIYRKEELRGKAVDVTEEGHLIIKLEDGSTREILSGEVSIRSVNGYI